MKKLCLVILLTLSAFSLIGCTDGSKIVKIAVTTMPTKAIYYIGQDTVLDLSGTMITLTAKNNKTSILGIDATSNNKAVFSVTQNIDYTTTGTYPVTVTYANGITTQFSVQVQQPPYVDDNPIKLGLYNDVTRGLLPSYAGPFVKDVDIGVFSVFFTQVPSAAKGYFQNVFTQYWDKYPNIDAYKIGYSISFKLTTGETMRKQILGPNDKPDFMWDYVRVYLYDDVHQPLHHWYSHLLESQITAKTLITSIKLTGNGKTNLIDGPITLTAFTYNGTDDFDPVSGLYRGISSYTILVSKQ